MELYCTRPSCPKPQNFCTDLDDPAVLKSTDQKYCTSCGMPLFLQGRYLTTRLLGEGGFGAAFLACDRLTPKLRPCVVKQFKPAMQLNAQQQELAHNLFEQEAEVLDQLGMENPHIPDLFAFFDLTVSHKSTGVGLRPTEADRLFYIVQEFIDGQTMEAAWGKGLPLSQPELVKMLNQLLPVLSFVHSHNVIHRDIKPSNIMRHKNGRFYLLDFGAIRDATKAGAKTSTTIYSLGYAPPEQMAGQEVFFSSDLYALAATCVVLLTCKEPRDLFNSATNQWKWASHAQVDAPIAQMLDKMLNPSPTDRFWSASDALQALQSATGRVVPLPLNSTTSIQPPPVIPPPMPVTTAPPASIPPPPAPPPIADNPPQPIVQPRSRTLSQPPFTLPEYLKGAMFTGFEGAVLAIGLHQLPLPLPVRGGLWLAIALILIFLQSRRIIEKIDLLILGAISLLVVGLIVRPDLQFLLMAIGGGICLGVAIGAIFRLLYQLLAKIL
jgi:serine/threonine protein kinase